jgi:hypothetical protein
MRLDDGNEGEHKTTELSEVAMHTKDKPFAPALSAYFTCNKSPSGLNKLILLSYRLFEADVDFQLWDLEKGADSRTRRNKN